MIKRGIKDALPLAFGYLPVAMTFGILAKTYGFPLWVPLVMSVLIYAGSSQFVGIQMLALSTSPVQIIMTIFIVNIRHFLMGTTMTQRFPEAVTNKKRALSAYFLTDEAFVFLSNQRELPPYAQMLSFQLTLYSAWVGGTFVGALMPAGLSPFLATSLGITIYALFISLIIPSMARSKGIAVLCTLAGILSWVLKTYDVATGWRIISVTMFVAFIGAMTFKEVSE